MLNQIFREEKKFQPRKSNYIIGSKWLGYKIQIKLDREKVCKTILSPCSSYTFISRIFLVHPRQRSNMRLSSLT